ncbi:MAG TPA: ABC transporter permease [Mycobacteriales bacterium]|nr:ABC transporter permease [Mycobacteriales bacterium]
MLLVAAREVEQRLRGRTFRIATFVMLIAIAAAIVIPALNNGHKPREIVGVTGTVPTRTRVAIEKTGAAFSAAVDIIGESTVAGARADLRSGRIDLLLIGNTSVELAHTLSKDDSSTKAQLARALALLLGEQRAFAAARLTPVQVSRISHIRPVAIHGLSPARSTGAEQGTSVIGLILLFVMLSQYGTWTLIGVMEEKASRVVEVLLAAVRPTQLLAGKVLGIGTLVFMQATVLVGFALGLAGAVGSDLLKGTAPAVVVATLFWLLLGYAFYSWVFAGAGSMVERQDQVQAIAFPITVPLLVGYVSSITAVSSGHASAYVTTLAYIPFTAPFAMPVLVGLHQATWWEFALSALISVTSTLGMAKAAGIVYRRAVLRTGSRVPWREVLSRPARPRSPGRSPGSPA